MPGMPTGFSRFPRWGHGVRGQFLEGDSGAAGARKLSWRVGAAPRLLTSPERPRPNRVRVNCRRSPAAASESTEPRQTHNTPGGRHTLTRTTPCCAPRATDGRIKSQEFPELENKKGSGSECESGDGRSVRYPTTLWWPPGSPSSAQGWTGAVARDWEKGRADKKRRGEVR